MNKFEEAYSYNSQYNVGAYYYKVLEFEWIDAAIFNSPSIYCLEYREFIIVPFLKSYMEKETSINQMYIPFISSDKEVYIKG